MAPKLWRQPHLKHVNHDASLRQCIMLIAFPTYCVSHKQETDFHHTCTINGID